MEKTLAILLLITLFLTAKNFISPPNEVLGEQKTPQDYLLEPQPIHTISRFETKLESTSQIIDRPIIYQDDPQSEIGQETTSQEGSDGKKTQITKITFYKGEEYSREIVSTEIIPPKNKIILRGTKIVWRSYKSPEGELNYWRTLHVWATHYDSHCPGCDQTTATGLKAGKGVIAVDPKVIPLGSKVYIPGYGTAIAGDTGGSIKGNIIDLGFDDAKTAGWYAHFIDIYLL